MIEYLVSKLICSGEGIDAFWDYEPDEPHNIIVVNEYTGMPSVTGIDCAVRNIQIVCRNTSATEARSKAWLIYNLLSQVAEPSIQLTSDRWCLMHPKHPPFKMKVDAQNRTSYVFNCGVTTYKDY